MSFQGDIWIRVEIFAARKLSSCPHKSMDLNEQSWVVCDIELGVMGVMCALLQVDDANALHRHSKKLL